MYFKKKLLYAFCAEKSNNDELFYFHSGWECCDSGYKFGPTIRDFYLIHVVVSGKGVYNARGKTYELKKNDAFLIYPSEITTYYADKDEPWEYCFFAFNGTKSMEYINQTGFSDGNLVIKLKDLSIVSLVEDVSIEISERNFPHIYSTGMLLLMLNKLMEEAQNDKPRNNCSESYVYSAKSYIAYNFSNNISVSSIAKMLSLNRSHFSRVFKSVEGISPCDYIIKYRVNNACKLLRETSLTLSEISNACGFESYVCFYKAFNKYTGKHPKEFRKIHE
ncbi:MAG: AraC family transcriptional regulator [Saccharofermentanales bacterium]